MILIGRSLGVKLYGEIVATIAIVSVFYSVGSMGVPFYLLHKRGSTDKSIHYGSLGYVALCSISSMVIVNLILFDKYREFSIWKSVLAVLIIIQAIYDVSIAYMQAESDFKGMSIVTLLMNPARFVGVVILFAISNKDIILYSSALTMPSVLLIYVFFRLIKRWVYPLSELRLKSFKNSLVLVCKESFPYAGESILYVSYFQLTTILLSNNCDVECVAQYSTAYTLSTATYLMGVIYFQKIAQVKILDKLYESKAQLKKSLISNSLIAVIAGLVIAIILMMFGQKVVAMLYGSEFVPNIWIIGMLALTVPIRYLISSLAAHMMTPFQTRLKMYVIGLVLIICCISATILSVKFGGMGAASSILLTELFWLFILSIVFYFFVYKNYSVVNL